MERAAGFRTARAGALWVVAACAACASFPWSTPRETARARHARREVEALAAALTDPRREVCLDAARRLGGMPLEALGPGKRGGGALRALTAALADGDPAVREAAASALEALGPGADRGARGALRALLHDPAPRVALAAARALAARGDAAGVRGLQGLRRSGEPLARIGALAALVRVGAAGRGARSRGAEPRGAEPLGAEPLGAFLGALESADPRLRALGFEGLAALGRGAWGAVPRLASLLGDPDPATRRGAASALVRLLPPGLAPLLQALSSGRGDVREDAARALGGGAAAARAAPPALRQAIPRLLELLHDRNPRVRAAAASALGRIAPGNEGVATALLAVLRQDPWARGAAKGALVAFPSAAPPLKALLDSEDPSLRFDAAEILIEIGTPGRAGPGRKPAAAAAARGALVRAWVRGAASPDPHESIATIASFVATGPAEDRGDALEILAWFGEDAAPAVAALVRTLGDPSPTLAALAARALGAIGPAASPAVPALVEGIRRGLGEGRRGPGPRDVALEAIRALGGIGVAAGDEALDALLEVARGRDREARLGALEALGRVGSARRGGGERVFAVLLEAAGSPVELEALTAARAAVRLARRQGRADRIEPLLGSTHPRIRAWARQVSTGAPGG